MKFLEEIWTKTDSYLDSLVSIDGGGNELSDEGWSLLINTTITGEGKGNYTSVIHVNPTSLSGDNKQSFYITSPSQIILFTENATGTGDDRVSLINYGDLAYEDDILAFSVGTGVTHRFGSHFLPNIFNGIVQFSPM